MTAAFREQALRERDVHRFWSKVALPDRHGCMLWTDVPNTNGYGKFRLNGTMVWAHRVSLWLSAGLPTEGRRHAAHSCRNTNCVAPAHLRWATVAENAADRKRDGTECLGQRHGHVRLADHQVLEIVERHKLGASQNSLAREFGVGRRTVQALLSGKTWGWLTGIAS